MTDGSRLFSKTPVIPGCASEPVDGYNEPLYKTAVQVYKKSVE